MISWLRLANISLSARTANAALDRFGSAEELFNAPHNDLYDLPGMTDKVVTRLLDSSYLPTQSQLTDIDRLEIRILHRFSAEYPQLLLQIPDPPPVLFIRGELEEKDRFAVGLVGSRRATPYGRSVAVKLARDLAKTGLTIISGGALGIDAAVHKEVLRHTGRTIAVLGCGLDIEYPRENLPIFEDIIREKRGAVISEYPPGTQPEGWRFPLRNRIISGMSMGVVVIEAGEQSGALLTATIAAEQGREVMAVPGNVDRIGSVGTNALIRDGAALIIDAKDVLRTLNIITPDDGISAQTALELTVGNIPDAQRKILETLDLTPQYIDAIAKETGGSTVEIGADLTLMELQGLVRRLPGNCYIRIL